MKIIIILLSLGIALSAGLTLNEQTEEKLLQQVKNWANRLGGELWHFGSSVTRKNMVVERYKSLSIENKDGDQLAKEIALKIKNMMDQKVAAVQRIMDAARNLAVSSGDKVDKEFLYYNANNLTETGPPSNQEKEVSDGEAKVSQASREESNQRPTWNNTVLHLTENPNFFNIPVNTEHSVVHVPTYVFDRWEEVIHEIKFTEKLDSIFKDNYRIDPTLFWQYFGSTTGFMRQFPARQWHQEPQDMYDCRTRSWYLEASSSPKDVVVLMDTSGSMKGLRIERAKNVAKSILDTLTDNDYVNIFTFSNVTKPLIDCFNDTLVQANLANLREMREVLQTRKLKLSNVTNFEVALTMAFKLLEDYRIGSRNKSGAGCNQAIMLITDGVYDHYKELFKEYNWRHLPYKPVRLFTYLIASEDVDVRAITWIACANQGYYANITLSPKSEDISESEVREKVLYYIPVMARPMVLGGLKPSPTWSSVYADTVDPQLTNWLWAMHQRRDQKERFLAYRRDPQTLTAITYKQFARQHKTSQDHYGDIHSYILMTSVSMPVYDGRLNATRDAKMLGVAGTDVPIYHIQQLMMPYMIGVNGYAFIITNNGYCLIHPDLRPTFQGILKPAYNRVDMAEVELPDDDLEPREFNRSLLAIRKEVVYKRQNKRTLDMKYHLDYMKRIMRGRRNYHYIGIDGTPFTLVVTLPERYGAIKLQHPIQEDIQRQVLNKVNLAKYFSGYNWKIHPNWMYCCYRSGNLRFNSSEDELRYFLARIQNEHLKLSNIMSGGGLSKACDRNLMNSLLYDAKATDFFDENLTTIVEDKKGYEFIRRSGITIAFIATHSGLTRWQDFPQNAQSDHENKTHPHFSEIHNRAIDEIWYRRAVEQHYVEEDSFVYSVPFDIGNNNKAFVTASQAVFLTKENRKLPVAAVGYQFYHSSFLSLFKNITNKCLEKTCSTTCSSDDISCYVLDNNGYVVLSYNAEDTGRWFGEVQIGIMKLLVRENVYNPVQMYDYQAVCFPAKGNPNPASRFITPFKHAAQIVQWVIGTLIYLFSAAMGTPVSENIPEPTVAAPWVKPTKEQEETKEIDKSILIDKRKPIPCDERRWLYELINHKNVQTAPYSKPMINCIRPFIVHRIQYSNLILLVVRTSCKMEDDEELLSPLGEEIDYNTTLACRIKEDDLPRNRYAQCINQHTNESAIELCGRSLILSFPTKMSLLFITLALLFYV